MHCTFYVGLATDIDSPFLVLLLLQYSSTSLTPLRRFLFHTATMIRLANMSRPELLPELWIRVFDFLKRDVPPPWKQATWSDFHQEDLTSVCLVSSVRSESACVRFSALSLDQYNVLIDADLIPAVLQTSSAHLIPLGSRQRPALLGHRPFRL
jgi:hypothetical protein